MINQTNATIQRSLNEAKKEELAEKYGASFSDGESNIDPELEGDFLNYVEEFERTWGHSDVITVWDFLGKPEILPADGLTDQELESELHRVSVIMEENQIALDCINEVSIQDRYKFISGDFMKVECNNIRIPGMTHHFIYEEFFPEA
jgi:hypothetical protein